MAKLCERDEATSGYTPSAMNPVLQSFHRGSFAYDLAYGQEGERILASLNHLLRNFQG